MDSYLAIAEQVLRAARRPLAAREILESAYALGIVPPRLFGKTQQKTMGARLSEDVLLRRDRSAFFRTEPGKFFLTEFLTDESIPERYRTPIMARRRERELQRGRYVAVREAVLQGAVGKGRRAKALKALRRQDVRYLDALSERAEGEVVLWSFVMVMRGDDVLSYRQGRYREGRDAFLQRRSIGFYTPVFDLDRDLFEQGDHGVVASGVRAVALDLDLPRTVSHDSEYQALAKLDDFLLHRDASTSALLAVVHFDCPSWFEPLTRRLAINDLAWLSLRSPVNHIEDFDPWSQLVLARVNRPSAISA